MNNALFSQEFLLDPYKTIFLMALVSFLILLTLVLKKKMAKKSGISIFINCVLFDMYFNWMFPYIPVYNYSPYPWSEFYWMGQFFRLSDYFSDIEMTKIVLKVNIPPAMVFIGISVINVITFGKRYSLFKNTIISLGSALTMILFPLFVNIYWGGVVWTINTIAPIIIIFNYFLGYIIGKLLIKLYILAFINNTVPASKEVKKEKI